MPGAAMLCTLPSRSSWAAPFSGPGRTAANGASRSRQAAAWPRARRHLRCLAASGDPSEEEGSSSSIPDSLPLAGADTDWRAFRARLVQSESGAPPAAAAAAAAGSEELWAHALPGLEVGCLLVAHPLMFTTSQTYFFQSVILIFSHNESGSAGLILNRPTDYLIEQTKGAEMLQPEMNACTLYLGGDVGKDTLHLLHGMPGLEDSVQVLKGVYIGGFPAAKQGLAAGDFKPEQFKVLTRYAGWGPGQLEEECQRGVWFPAAASSSFVLQQQQRGREAGAGGAARELGPGAEMWHAALRLMGGEYAELSQAMTEVYREDIMGGAQQPQQQQPEDDSSTQ